MARADYVLRYRPLGGFGRWKHATVAAERGKAHREEAITLIGDDQHADRLAFDFDRDGPRCGRPRLNMMLHGEVSIGAGNRRPGC